MFIIYIHERGLRRSLFISYVGGVEARGLVDYFGKVRRFCRYCLFSNKCSNISQHKQD